MFCCLSELSYTTIGIIVSVFVAIYFYLSRNFNYWSSRGIKGPKPLVILGNIWEAFFKTLPEIEEERLAKYGNIYGFVFSSINCYVNQFMIKLLENYSLFLGSEPFLVVAEPELIKNIMIRDFNVFVNRNDIKIGDPIVDRALSVVWDDEWKNLRSIVKMILLNST